MNFDLKFFFGMIKGCLFSWNIIKRIFFAVICFNALSETFVLKHFCAYHRMRERTPQSRGADSLSVSYWLHKMRTSLLSRSVFAKLSFSWHNSILFTGPFLHRYKNSLFLFFKQSFSSVPVQNGPMVVVPTVIILAQIYLCLSKIAK